MVLRCSSCRRRSPRTHCDGTGRPDQVVVLANPQSVTRPTCVPPCGAHRWPGARFLAQRGPFGTPALEKGCTSCCAWAHPRHLARYGPPRRRSARLRQRTCELGRGPGTVYPVRCTKSYSGGGTLRGTSSATRFRCRRPASRGRCQLRAPLGDRVAIPTEGEFRSCPNRIEADAVQSAPPFASCT